MYFFALIFLAYILYARKPSFSLKIYCFFYLISDILNPLIFLNNEDMYLRSSWGYLGEFDFNYERLVEAYLKSYQVIFMVIVFNYLLTIFANFKDRTTVFIIEDSSRPKNCFYLYAYLFLTAILYIIFYELKIGITGVAGGYKYHLSGIVHYYRSYISPAIILFLIYKIKNINNKDYIIFFLYSLISGTSSCSRFVAVTPIILIAPFFAQNKIIYRTIILALTAIICFTLVTVSRDITYEQSDLSFFDTFTYSIFSLKEADFLYILDTFTGRLSGAQQTILASQFSGAESCNNIFLFFLGNPICHDIAFDIYKIDLSGTEYGLGFGVISSIIIHDSNWYSYIAPAFLISFLLFISDAIANIFFKDKFLRKIYYYYIFLSTIFLFAGPLKFFYVLFAISLIIIFIRRNIKSA